MIPPLSHGGLATPIDFVTPEDRAAKLAVQYGALGSAAKRLEVRPQADRALRDTLGLCREHGIRPVLFFSPEGEGFRKFYDPAALARFEAYIGGVAAEHDVRLIDARGWLSEDDFMDSHHMLRRGSVAFTARLVKEVSRGGW